jgi:hypothetical protein
MKKLLMFSQIHLMKSTRKMYVELITSIIGFPETKCKLKTQFDVAVLLVIAGLRFESETGMES